MKDLIFRLALKFHVILLICAGSVCATAAGDSVVRSVGYIGEGAVCRLFASFEKTSRGLILVVR